MERKYISEKELLAYLNRELEKAGQHEDCYFESLVRLRLDDRAGCNWSSANIKCRGQAGNACPADAEKIVNQAKALFNLKD